MEGLIYATIASYVAIVLNRHEVTWAEVEEIYASGKYPEINATIDYIIGK